MVTPPRIGPEPIKHDSPVFKGSQHFPSRAGCIAIAQELELRPGGNTVLMTKTVFLPLANGLVAAAKIRSHDQNCISAAVQWVGTPRKYGPDQNGKS